LPLSQGIPKLFLAQRKEIQKRLCLLPMFTCAAPRIAQHNVLSFMLRHRRDHGFVDGDIPVSPGGLKSASMAFVGSIGFGDLTSMRIA
jgi:hypothetical protein